MEFETDVTAFSMDISRSNGSSAGQTFAIDFFDDGGLVGSDFITLGDINVWSEISFLGVFDEIQFLGSQNGFSPFGIDDIQFVKVPAPGALCLLGLAGLIGTRRRR